MTNSTPRELDLVAARASAAASPWAKTAPRERAAALVSIANALTASGAELVATAIAETGPTEARLTGELKRTAVQLRMPCSMALTWTCGSTKPIPTLPWASALMCADTGYRSGRC